MAQLDTLKAVLNNPPVSDELLQFYLDNAKDIICDIRQSDYVEDIYLTTQIKIAIELYSKNGAEGQISHSENDISRSYECGDVSLSLLNQITPFVKTPFSTRRTVVV